MIAGMLCFSRYETTDYMGSPRNGFTSLSPSFHWARNFQLCNRHGRRLVDLISQFICTTRLGGFDVARDLFNTWTIFIHHQRFDVLGGS